MGFSHASLQSRAVYEKYNKKTTIWFYILKGRLNSIFFLFQAVFVKKVQIGIVKLQVVEFIQFALKKIIQNKLQKLFKTNVIITYKITKTKA
jgi:hypothetical protein